MPRNRAENLAEQNAETLLATSIQELWSWDTGYREHIQLSIARDRFLSLRPRIGQLEKLGGLQGIGAIETLEDLAPLLFQDTVYKSYPVGLLNKGRFDLLTRWLDGLTSHDLGAVDVSGCRGFDDWFDALEAQTPLRPNHSTGTSGKLSVIPRDATEVGRFERGQLKTYESFGDEPDRLGALRQQDGPVPIVYPSYRHGRHVAQRMLNGLIRTIGSEATTYSLHDEFMSADVASLAGRVKGAGASGNLDTLEINEDILARFRKSVDRQAGQAQERDRFFETILARLKGKPVFAFGVVPLLFDWALKGEERGLTGLFAPESIVVSGGGLKGVQMPEDWQERVERFLGVPLRFGYGMSESITGNPMCPAGHYHPLPFTLAFVLDAESGKPKPRNGTQTGRYAFFDLLAESFWGGFVTGDRVTIGWDGCPCGRTGPYIHRTIERFSELGGGDDKISCSGSVDAHEQAMAWLVSQTQGRE